MTSGVVSIGFLNYKNRSMSLLASSMDTMRNAFSMSAVRVIGSDLNLTRTSNNCGMRFGPTSKQSFRE